jgi:hypothetical protein
MYAFQMLAEFGGGAGSRTRVRKGHLRHFYERSPHTEFRPAVPRTGTLPEGYLDVLSVRLRELVHKHPDLDDALAELSGEDRVGRLLN